MVVPSKKPLISGWGSLSVSSVVVVGPSLAGSFQPSIIGTISVDNKVVWGYFPEREKRFEIIYNLLSLQLNKRLLIKIILSENENAESVESIFHAAQWYEREIFDMYGINFNG